MESSRPKVKEKVLQEVNKIWYTNVNGLMSKRLELENLLEQEKPDMMILTERKMSGAFQALVTENMIFGSEIERTKMVGE